MIALQIHVIGRVQGVFFRASTKEKADTLGLTGWVKNEPDGSVLIQAEGQVEKLDELIKWCADGPQMAHVENVSLKEIGLQHFSDFRITH